MNSQDIAETVNSRRTVPPTNAVQVVMQRSDDNGNPPGAFLWKVLAVPDVNINRTAIVALESASGNECIVALKAMETGVSLNANDSF